MTRVGIVTTFYGNNFGEFLQAFALRRAINTTISGCRACMVNFKTGEYHPLQKPGFERFVRDNEQKDELFAGFRRKYLDIDEAPASHLNTMNCPDFDSFVFGSDGIWATNVWEIPEFFGSFVPHGLPKIAYAPSVAAYPDDPMLRVGMFERYMPTFKHLSVREDVHVPFVQRFAPDTPVQHVCDPTLLLSTDVYDRLATGIEPPKPSRPYIFFYQPHAADGAILSLVAKLSQMYGFDVVHTFADIPKRVFPYSSQSARFAGPLEFISYVRDAAIIVTRSYHAAIFAILYGRPVYAYVDKKSGTRFESLFRMLGMQDRLVHTYIAPEEVRLTYDYGCAYGKLEDFKKRSLAYLSRALLDEGTQ